MEDFAGITPTWGRSRDPSPAEGASSVRRKVPLAIISAALVLALVPRLVDAKTVIHSPIVSLTLERQGCFMGCDEDRVRFERDGTVSYAGVENLHMLGLYRGNISPEAFEEIVRTIEHEGVLEWPDHLPATVYDAPTYRLTISMERAAKTIQIDGASAAANDFFTKIDELQAGAGLKPSSPLNAFAGTFFGSSATRSYHVEVGVRQGDAFTIHVASNAFDPCTGKTADATREETISLSGDATAAVGIEDPLLSLHPVNGSLQMERAGENIDLTTYNVIRDPAPKIVVPTKWCKDPGLPPQRVG
jgi:Domain of unknown function (DUF6438)